MGTGNKTRKTAVAGAPVAATEKIISKALLSRSEEKYAAAVRELIELCADEIAEGLTDERGRDARGTREGQGHWLPPPGRVASDLRASFANTDRRR